MSHVDMKTTTAVLDEVDALIETLDHAPFGNETGRKNTENATVTRNLLRLADRLELASALVRNQYWRARGYDDPMER